MMKTLDRRRSSVVSDAPMAAGGCAVLLVWFASLLVGLAFWVVVIWAIIKLVSQV